MYITKQQMIDRFEMQSLIELTDRNEPYTGVIVDAVLDASILDAAALIDAHISKRYDLPLATVPTVLINVASSIVYYMLHRGRHSDEVRKNYEDALDVLKRISSGSVLLDVAGSEPKSSVADARVDGPARIFSKDSMEGF